jgi:hypothetical protein
MSMMAFTQTLFNVDPVKFALGGTSAGLGAPYASGVTKISFNELFNFDKYKGDSEYAKGTSLQDQIWSNVKKNWWQGAGLMIAAGVLPKVMNKLPGRPIQKTNRMLRDAGVDFVAL